MGVLKLKPNDFEKLRQIPNDLSEFWKGYFAHVAIDLNRLFFKYTQEPMTIKYLHRDVIRAKDYFATISEFSVIKPFNISPMKGIGFFYFTNDLCNYFIDCLLGGSDKNQTQSRPITSTDQKVLEHILNDIMITLQKQMEAENRVIDFESVDPKDVSLFTNSQAAEQYISVQQFLVVNGHRTFVFDIAFSNRILEEFLLI